MRKILILVGVNGSLGRGASEVLLQKDYDKIYLCDRKAINWTDPNERIGIIKIDDLAEEANVREIFTEIDADSDDKIFLFSTVGGFYSANIEELEEVKLNQMFRINVISAFLLTKHFTKFISDKKSGALCFTSAQTAGKPSPGKSAYGASKGALEYLIRTVALELKDKRIGVYGIAPFALDTPDNREWIKDKGLLISPENIGETVHTLFENHPGNSGRIVEMPDNIE